MKKLHLISAMYVSKGHGFEYTRNFCEHLKDHYRIVLHIASKNPQKTPVGVEINYTNIEYERTDAKNFSKYGVLGPYMRALLKQYLSYRYFKAILASTEWSKEDFVYIMDYDVFPLPKLILGLKKKGIANVFLWMHNAKFNSKDLLYSGYKYFFKYSFQNFIVKNIKGIVVNGEYIKNQVIENLDLPNDFIALIQYPSKILYDKTPKHVARQKLDLKDDENVVLFFGMLRSDKNIEFTIESVANSKTSTKLIIAGSEASVTKENINEWIEKHGLRNYLLDIDYVSEEKMALYYSCSDLLLLTYNLESGSQSGPLALAREFELPALVTDVGEIGKYVVDNNVGLVGSLERREGFSDQIDHFFGLAEDQQKDIEKSLKFAKDQYSWEAAAQKYLALFNV